MTVAAAEGPEGSGMRDQHVVVTGASSATHLLYVASWLRHLLGRTTGEVAVFHPPARQVDLARHRDLLPEHPRLRVGSDPAGWVCPTGHELTYVAVGAPGLKPWARLRRANPRVRLRVVVTDEGLGTYGGWRTRRAAWAREGVTEPWRTVRTTAVVGGARLLTTTRWALYEQHQGRWQVHEEVAAELRRHVPARSSGSDEVVLLTQPWVELGLVDEAAQRAQVQALAAQVEGAGGRLVVRPHPAEQPARYAGHPVLAGPRPVELDPRVVGARAVVGATSTALLNLAAVHGVPAVRVPVPGRPELDTDLSPRQASLLETFVGSPVPLDEVGDRLRAR